jgi:hypothetical protein
MEDLAALESGDDCDILVTRYRGIWIIFAIVATKYSHEAGREMQG